MNKPKSIDYGTWDELDNDQKRRVIQQESYKKDCNRVLNKCPGKDIKTSNLIKMITSNNIKISQKASRILDNRFKEYDT